MNDPPAAPGKVVALVGPTAVGKTVLSLRLADLLKAEIVGADSMQVYRGMDIGTAKPSPEERAAVVHHLIDIVYPDEAFHAKRYQQEADRTVEELRRRGKVPLVVGGTGLYIKALFHGLFDDPPRHENESWRQRMEPYQRFGEDPYPMLVRVDPAAARNIHPNDSVRAQRALDVFFRTGKSITDLRSRHRFQENRYESLLVGLRMDRETLNRRINTRVDRMIRTGLLEEVQGLMLQGYSPDLPPMKSLGYRHMACVLKGTWALDDAIETLKRDTRRYAKRQRTWFQHQERVVWFHETDPVEKIYETIQRFFQGQIKEIV